MVKRWDEQAGAYVETSNVPMRYDPEAAAWAETTGKAYDQTAGAWEEKWSPTKKFYLYNAGYECTDVTGGWVGGDYRNLLTYSVNIGELKSNQMYFKYNDASKNQSVVITAKNSISFNGYKKIGFNVSSLNPADSNGYINLEIHDALKKERICAISTMSIGEYTIEISEITSDVFILVRAVLGENTSTSYYATVDKIWIEK